MIELSTTSFKPAVPTPAPVAPGAAPGGFMQTLAAFLDAAAGEPPTAPATAGLPDDRQAFADDGKTVPDTGDTDAQDPALIWLPVPLPQQLPTVRPAPLPWGGGRAQVDAGTIFSGAAAKAGEKPAATPTTQTTGASAATDAQEIAAADASAKELPRAVPTTAVDPAAAPAAAPTAQPAGQVFAAAIAAASGNRERPARDDDDRGAPGGTLMVATAQIDTAHRPVVQPTSDVRHAPLDLRDDRGLQGMIDRIEVLRDDADARDTRIRLVPDALGGIDLSVRKDGDTVHVHFTAENQATRTLLTEAQPRLAELAEARGVKLGGATVDAGTGGGANQPPRFEPARHGAPPAAATGAADTETPTDQRLA
jgi:flagellar hook-length control protein FliK